MREIQPYVHELLNGCSATICGVQTSWFDDKAFSVLNIPFSILCYFLLPPSGLRTLSFVRSLFCKFWNHREENEAKLVLLRKHSKNPFSLRLFIIQHQRNFDIQNKIHPT